MSDQDRKTSDDASRVVARRYFIRAAVYAAPAVASIVAVQHASAQASVCAQPICVLCSQQTCIDNHCPSCP